MIVPQKPTNNSSEVSFAEHDDVVEALAAHDPDYSLHIWRLPGTAWCSDNLLDIEGLHQVLKHQPINSIPIADEVAQGFLIVERLNQLPRGPGGGRMFRHVEVHDLAAMASENDENKQDAVDACDDLDPRLEPTQ
jgi:hypothetical protein